MKDQLPTRVRNGNYIINLDSSNGGKNKGTHWTALVIHNKDALFFDPFGATPSVEIREFVKRRKGSRVGFNNWVIQDLKSENCGYFCLSFLMNIQSNHLYTSANDYINEYIDSAKSNYKKQLLINIFNDPKYTKDYEVFDVNNIKKILAQYDAKDYRKNKRNFIDESSKKIKLYYNYNYNSYNEKLLCYNSNVKIINLLLENPRTNYYDIDKDGNNILHYLIRIENSRFFNTVYDKNKIKIKKFINSKNRFNKSPIDIIKDKIKVNINNFYYVHNDKKEIETKLQFSLTFSNNLYIKLQNENDVKKYIPNNIKNIYDDLFIIFNLKNPSKDIFLEIVNSLSGNEKIYRKLFEFNKDLNNKWNSRDTSDSDLNIKEDLYDSILQKYSSNKKLSENEYYKRYYNTIVHVITLHFTSVFYDMINDFIQANKGSLVGSLDLTEFKNSLFNFDPEYKKRNLAQEIIINLYKKKYSSDIKEEKKLTELNTILNLKLNKIDILNSSNRTYEYEQQIEKILLVLNAYFNCFKDTLEIFLSSYVKFIELQYNLQQIRDSLLKP